MTPPVLNVLSTLKVHHCTLFWFINFYFLASRIRHGEKRCQSVSNRCYFIANGSAAISNRSAVKVRPYWVNIPTHVEPGVKTTSWIVKMLQMKPWKIYRPAGQFSCLNHSPYNMTRYFRTVPSISYVWTRVLYNLHIYYVFPIYNQASLMEQLL